MKNVDVLILASNQKTFSKEEVSNVTNLVADGGGLVVWPDSAFGRHYKHIGQDNSTRRDSNTLITEPIGMCFLTYNGGGNYLIKDYTENHFINDYNKKAALYLEEKALALLGCCLLLKY